MPRPLGVRPRLVRLEDRAVPSTSIPLSATTWTALGPAPITSGTAPGTLSSSGRVAALAADPTDPNILYVGAASGGVWKTTNATVTTPTWTPLTDAQAALTTGAIALAPSDPNTIYVDTGEPNNASDSFYGRGVLKSTDGGATWTQLTDGGIFDRHTISRIVVLPTDANTVYLTVHGGGVNGAGGNTGVWRSADGGATWALLTAAIDTNAAFTDFELDPADPNTAYCAVGSSGGNSANGVYITSDLLDAVPTWTRATGLPSGTANGRTLLAVARTTVANQTVVYVAITSPSTSGLAGFFQSTDGGATWTQRTGTPNYLSSQGWYDTSLLADPADPTGNTVIAGGAAGSQRLIRSTDGGASWATLIPTSGNAPHVDHHALAFDAADRLIDGDDGGVYRLNALSPLTWVSLNGAATAGQSAPTALDTNQFVGIAIHPTNPNLAIGGTQDNGTQRFNDAFGWTTSDGGDGGDVLWDPGNTNYLYRVSPVSSFGSTAFVRRSTNGGTSFGSITSGIVNAGSAQFYPPLALDPASGSHRVFLGTNVVNVLADGTAASPVWAQYGAALPSSSSIRAIGIGPASPNTLYVSSNAGAVYVTTDGGATWSTRTPPGGGTFQDFAVDPTDSNVAYVVSPTFSGAARVWRTANAGVTWTNITGNLPNVPAWALQFDPSPTAGPADDTLYLGNDRGVYRSTDFASGSPTWVRFGAGLPTVQVRDLEFSPTLGVLAAGTYGRGVWEIAIPPAALAIRRTGSSPTNASTVAFAVTFSKPVTGLTVANFTVTATGVTGAAVVGVTGTGVVYTVTVATGGGDGTLCLDLADSTGLTDLVRIPVGNVPFTGGEVYVLDRTPPTVAAAVVNDGSDQRSRVTSLTVTFSEVVTLGPGAFALDGFAGTLSVAASVVGGQTMAVLTFAGPGTEFGSLADGRYTLRVIPGQVTDAAGNALDGDGDGLAGGDYAFGLFRFYGDVNGDGVVNGLDFGLFRAAFGTAAGDHRQRLLRHHPGQRA
jgi:hypothetical protein